jgi:putative DNA primase/helicase
LKLRYRIHVCFSAGNLQNMAKSGYVIADHDSSGTGQAAAEATGLPFWMPPEEGTDLNDRHIDIGLFRLSQDIRKWLRGLI